MTAFDRVLSFFRGDKTEIAFSVNRGSGPFVLAATALGLSALLGISGASSIEVGSNSKASHPVMVKNNSASFPAKLSSSKLFEHSVDTLNGLPSRLDFWLWRILLVRRLDGLRPCSH